MNAEPRPSHSADWHIDHLRTEAERFATAIERSDLAAPVASCPGWTISRLTEHLGQIHRWADFCASNSRPPSAEEADALETYDETDATEWFRSGAAQIAATLDRLDPTAPTWHPFPVEQVGAFWSRRQAHETSMHRWDVEDALGTAGPIDAELASDGIDEYFEAIVPRLAQKGAELPAGSLHVHCTDVAGEWLVSLVAGEYQVIRAHEKGDAVMRGPAASMLLRLWGRAVDDPEVQHFGDEGVLADWLAVGGN